MSTGLEKRSDNEVSRAQATRERPWFQPTVNIYETSEELVLSATMPGSSAKDIDIEYENGLLTIHGKVNARAPEHARFLVREYAIGDYHRRFEVNERIDSDRISADYAHGVLTLRLPKAEEVKPKRISVSTK